jgi:hypothetical protein
MQKELIILPILLMVLLTIFVWGRMIWVRLSVMKSIDIHPEKMKSQKGKQLFPEEINIPAENFVNLFEIPIVFYLLSTLLLVTDSVSLFYLVASFIYVVLRYVHSFIALTYNKVVHRFKAYLLSCLVVFIMWGKFSYDLLLSFG